MTFTMRAAAVVLALAVAGVHPVAAQVPDTDIWIADIALRQDGLHIENPVNATHRPGYDNQPAFTWYYRLINSAPPSVDGFLFTSADSLGATDIFRCDLRKRAIVRVTHTPESEYSPTPFLSESYSMTPDGFYCVRVEADSTQRLWRFDIDGSNPRLVMADVDSVGYFAWIDDGHLAAFVLGNEKKKEPHTLRVIDVATQRETIVARGIGRSITRIAGSYDIAFTMQDNEDSFRFMRLRYGSRVGEPLINAIGTGQDAAWIGHTEVWLSDTMLMSAGSAIYASDPAAGRSDVREAWRQVADFARQGISGITRMVVSPDQRHIAFVAVKDAP
jgi:hypothetical protein